MPKLTIVIGANGAGKTTWCREERSRLPKHFYNADSIAEGLGDWNSPTQQRQSRRLVDKAVERHLAENEDFGFESTYSGNSRPMIVRNAASRGYEVEAVFVGTNTPAINIDRVKARVDAGTGHDVPDSEIRRRWSTAQRNLAETAPFINTIHLYDNSEAKSRHVAWITKTNIRLTQKLPKWTSRLIEKIEKYDQDRKSAGTRARTSPPELGGPPPNPETPPARADGTAAARTQPQGQERTRY